ncbi:MAG: hypothetical protein KGI54_15140 [Pseudomonadota bacterium]|nr:hypothetical protein [Pseudomonadota bacterium]
MKKYLAMIYTGQSNTNKHFKYINDLCDFIASTPDSTGIVEDDEGDTILEINNSQKGEVFIRTGGKIYDIEYFSVKNLPGKFYKQQKMGGWVHVNYLIDGKLELAASAILGNYESGIKNSNFRNQIKSDLLKFGVKKLIGNEINV